MGCCLSKKQPEEKIEDPITHESTGWTHTAWSGGAAKGILYVGAYQELWEAKIISRAQGAVGTSIGSVFATIACAEIHPDAVTAWVLDLDTGRIFDNSWCTLNDIVDFTKRHGIYRGDYLETKCEEFLAAQTGIPHITFRKLFAITGRHLKICVTNITHGRAEYWDHVSFPDMPIAHAIRASASMPIIFDPIHMGDCVYGDGGIIDNYPLGAFGNKSTLGLLLLGTYETEDGQVKPQPTGSLVEYALAVYGCVSSSQFALQHPGTEWIKRTVSLRGPSQAQWEAAMSRGDKIRWISAGAVQTSKKINGELA